MLARLGQCTQYARLAVNSAEQWGIEADRNAQHWAALDMVVHWPAFVSMSDRLSQAESFWHDYAALVTSVDKSDPAFWVIPGCRPLMLPEIELRRHRAADRAVERVTDARAYAVSFAGRAVEFARYWGVEVPPHLQRRADGEM